MSESSEMPMTKTDFARLMGVDKAQPTRWAQMGMPTLPDGRLDPVEAAEWVRRNVDPTQRAHRSGGTMRGMQAELRRRIEAGDELARLTMWLLAQQMPNTAAEAAVAVGIPLPQVRALYDLLLEWMPEVTNDLRETLGFPSGERGPLKRGSMEHMRQFSPDWDALTASPPTRPGVLLFL